jgi:hypothetical protein
MATTSYEQFSVNAEKEIHMYIARQVQSTQTAALPHTPARNAPMALHY